MDVGASDNDQVPTGESIRHIVQIREAAEDVGGFSAIDAMLDLLEYRP
jgi:hypothetical protein